jgi:predicted N-formylglutamate amidohydrolase
MASKANQDGRPATASDAMMSACVEASKRYQDLGRDIEAMRDHLALEDTTLAIAARVAACMLTTAMLERELSRLLITALAESSGE